MKLDGVPVLFLFRNFLSAPADPDWPSVLVDLLPKPRQAREAPTEHPQWEFEDDDDEEGSKDEDSDDEFATDDEFDDDDDDANDD